MKRRDFLALLGAGAALPGCGPLPWARPTVAVHRPGMEAGHRLRDGAGWPAPAGDITTEVAILGSGIAGLTAAWKLAKEGFHDFVLLTGPEPLGNAAGGRFDAPGGALAFPRGAHYLPLPSRESTHVREMLADFGVLSGDAGAPTTRFDEAALVHAPQERLYHDGAWHEGLLPPPADALEAAQHARFLAWTGECARARGADGRKAFCIPLELSSRDPRWTRLDTLTFARWLEQEGYTAPGLRWYLDHCCRDDYGARADTVSAWAGLHYFASRGGHAANAGDGAVLTWPDGLQALATRLRDAALAPAETHPGASGIAANHGLSATPARRVPRVPGTGRTPAGAAQPRELAGLALRVRETGAARRDARGMETLCLAADGRHAFRLRSRRVICALPLHVAARVVGPPGTAGPDVAAALPRQASWLVSNILLEGFPPEAGDVPLSWDNVVQGSPHLGYVVSTHQQIRQARPAHSVFTAYHAFAGGNPADTRRRLESAGTEALRDIACADLLAVYGRDLWRHVRALDLTVRGHAMAVPTPGFLGHPGALALREADQRLLFAHSDLSGMSLFEEAAWWGYRAALRVL